MEEKPNYYAVIPANVRYDNSLRANEKLLYGEITALAQKTGECWANNQYFSELYEVKVNAIATWIKHLKEKEYIIVDYEYEKGTKEIAKRIIKIGGIQKDSTSYSKRYRGGIQKDKDNNTSINNTSIKENIKRKDKFIKPTLEEVKNYCEERNNGIDAEQFIDFYESKDWLIGKNKMKDWKACIRTWERRTKPKQVDIPKWFDKELEVEEIDDETRRLIEEIKGS